MASNPDQEFLLLLAHRGHLPVDLAREFFDDLARGEDLDGLLETRAGLSNDEIARLRRTRAGEIPEIPGYEILGKLGSGGTADVFRARDKKTLRVMALKVLRPDKARHLPTRGMFISEARLLEKLSHPALVKGMGVAKSGETYFSRMELIEGKTLLEVLEAGRAFDETTALRLVLEVAEVLAYLTSQNVIHRDVKPGNIMLASNGRTKMIDLGFAGAPDQAPKDDDTTVGTAEYLSPEQARGGAAADMRSDIYSLGVTLFHLAVGRLPFDSSDNREVLRMQVMESLRSPELKGRGFSHHLQYFIEKMMAKNLDARYQSWEQLMADIRAQIQGRDSLDFSKDARRPRGPGAQPGRR
jgi:serine/threonine-protein kinase